MFSYVVRRLAFGALTIVGVSIVVFVVMRVLPGDPLVAIFGTEGFTKLTPEQRANYMSALGLSDPPLPVDDSSGGCDTSADQFYKAWTREIAILPIAPEDVVSDDGVQIYSFLRERGIHNLLVMGVHANMCILNRSFAIKKMTNWGIRCVLVRDLTDSMYNPQDRPRVSHDQGTELIVQHIEKYWCPSTLSAELKNALEQAR